MSSCVHPPGAPHIFDFPNSNAGAGVGAGYAEGAEGAAARGSARRAVTHAVLFVTVPFKHVHAGGAGETQGAPGIVVRALRLCGELGDRCC